MMIFLFLYKWEAIILLILLLICTKDKGWLERSEGKKTPFIPVVKYIIMHISVVCSLVLETER